MIPTFNNFAFRNLIAANKYVINKWNRLLANNSSKINTGLQDSIKIKSNQNVRCTFIPYIKF